MSGGGRRAGSIALLVVMGALAALYVAFALERWAEGLERLAAMLFGG